MLDESERQRAFAHFRPVGATPEVKDAPGFCFGSVCHLNPYFGNEAEIARMADAMALVGLKIVRTDFRTWSDFDYAWYDKVVDIFSARGINFDFILGAICHPDGTPDLEKSRTAYRTAFARYKGRVKFWEMFNEPDHDWGREHPLRAPGYAEVARQTAADLLNHAEETKLADIFYLYGEIKNARRLAAAIAKKRTVMGIQTTQDLLDAIGPMLPKEREKKEMAKVFQALRIEVNHEMDALKEMLKGATEVLCEGGRLSIITYHSLEDRIVKNVMKAGNAEGKVEQDFFGRIQSPFMLVNGKVITPSEEEQQRNPRSRSAKLRIAEKK
jgi:hypothetical protein